MKIAELIIIYLACGSPFGVQYFLQRRTQPAALTIAGGLLRFMFWPLTASVLAYRTFVGAGAIVPLLKERSIGAELNRLRVLFESAVHGQEASVSVFDARDTFLRYTGLAIASGRPQTSPGSVELFEISGHENSAVASVCLQRKISSRLNEHRIQSRNEFAGLISLLATHNYAEAKVAVLAVETAECVRDHEFANQLRSTYGIAAISKMTVAGHDPLGEMWNSTSQSHSAAN